jgi:hypothetical protein
MPDGKSGVNVDYDNCNSVFCPDKLLNDFSNNAARKANAGNAIAMVRAFALYFKIVGQFISCVWNNSINPINPITLY